MDAKIKGSFWTDERVENCSKDEKFACLWLMTNPARDLCGFTKVSNKRFEFETGLEVSTLEGASKHLPSSIIKLPGGTWFVVNFLRQQFGNGGRLKLGNKVVIAAARHAAAMPTALANAFFEAYPELRELGLAHHLEQTKMEGASIPHTGFPDGVREEKSSIEHSLSHGTGGIPEEQARQLCKEHPMRSLTRPALQAAMECLRKHPFELVLTGTRAYADAVEKWTPAERLQFVKNPEAFFREDIWNQPAANWGSRIKARQSAAVVDMEAAKRSLGRRAAHIS